MINILQFLRLSAIFMMLGIVSAYAAAHRVDGDDTTHLFDQTFRRGLLTHIPEEMSTLANSVFKPTMHYCGAGGGKPPSPKSTVISPILEDIDTSDKCTLGAFPVRQVAIESLNLMNFSLWSQELFKPKPIYRAVEDKNIHEVIRLLREGANPYEKSGGIVHTSFSSALELLVSPALWKGKKPLSLPKIKLVIRGFKEEVIEFTQQEVGQPIQFPIYFPTDDPDSFHQMVELIYRKRESWTAEQMPFLQRLLKEDAWLRRRAVLVSKVSN